MAKGILLLNMGDIGKVIAIQAFKRDKKEPSTLIEDSMVKYVGKLLAYKWHANTGRMVVYFEGVGPTFLDCHELYVEVFRRDIL